MTDLAEHVSVAGDAALSRCVSCTADEFAQQYWGRAPLLTKAEEFVARGDMWPGFTDLLDPAAIDDLIAVRGLRTPFLRMAKDGKDLTNGAFTRSGGAGASIADQAADDKVLSAMAGGTTLVLHALHRTYEPLIDFGSRLSTELGHPVQINSYITPPQNQGFASHYDVHDVFVLQVAGRKRWTIHEPVVPAPLDNQPWNNHSAAVKERAAQPPLIDTTLEPGDAMYLPRGTIHSAQALGETSIHLTIGVHPITHYHLAKHLLDLAQDDPALRTSLPMGVDLTDPAVLADHLVATADALRARVGTEDPAEVSRRVARDLRERTRPEAVRPLAQLAAVDALTPDTPLRLRGGLRCDLEVHPDEVRLHVIDHYVHLRPAALDAARRILTGESFSPASLPGLDPASQMTLATGLLREGVIVPANGPRPDHR